MSEKLKPINVMKTLFERLTPDNASNFKTMKKYRITIRTYFGSIEIDGIEAEDEDEAFDKACEEAKKEIDSAKLDEVYEYDS